tara:strand:+ start:2280 stop:4802 length:2523 start_codon:yes stop_codon:yes gene_type:complete
MKKVFDQVLPHAIAVVLLFLIAAAFYSPAFMKGERMKQGDIEKFRGMSHETLSYEAVEGEKPSWTNSMFSGMPTIQITGLGFTTLPKVIWLILRFFMSPELMTLFMAMLAGYVLALCLKAPPWIAFVVGATFGLSTVTTLYLAAGHASKVRAIAVMPGVLGGVICAFRGKRAAGVGIFTLFLALHLYANHLQMTYYLMFLVGAVGLWELISSLQKGQTRYALITSLFLLMGTFCAALPQSADLYLTQEYASQTTRGEAILTDPNAANTLLAEDGLANHYILEYSMARGEWLSVFVPNIKGGSDPLYWGEQRYSGGAFYFGAIAFALCLAFFFVGKDRMKWPLLFVTVLAILLSWRDTSFVSDFFIDYFPLFNKFRDTKMMLVIVQVAVATGATLALKEIWEETSSKNWKPWLYSFGGIVVVLALFYALPLVFFDFTSSIRNDQAVLQLGKSSAVDLRIDIFRSDILRTMGLLIVFLSLVILTLKNILNRKASIALLSVLMIAEIIAVNSRYSVNWVPAFEATYPFEPTPPDLAILSSQTEGLNGYEDLRQSYIEIEEEKLGHKLTRRHSRAELAASFGALNALTHYRVFDWQNPFNDARTSYFHKSVGGYHGAKLQRYQDFIDRVLRPEIEDFKAFAESSGIGLATTRLKALAMLNTQYIILPGAEQPLPLGGALGPAWVADNILWVDDAEAEISQIRNVDLASTAIMHTDFLSETASFSIADSNVPSDNISDVSLIHYHPDGSTYEVSTSQDGLFVLSEVWYPDGWKATVDGLEVPLVRANYILRALPIAAGRHTVELSFEPSGRKLAGLASGLGSAVLLIFLLSMNYMAYMESRKSVG